MDVSVQRTEARAVVRPNAELNLFVADDFRQVVSDLVSDGVQELVLDCRSLVRVDSSGLGALIFTRRDLEERGCRVALAAVPERMQDLLRLSGLWDYFTIFDAVESAQSSLSQAG